MVDANRTLAQIRESPAKSAIARRKQLAEIAKLDDKDLEALSPQEIKDILNNAANLDENDKPKDKESSLRINIELDIEVEVHLNARVKGDVTIGLL
ncbi:hypothetical protein D0869_01802 [Hortaea werneckii]|uniref:Uncharacterized protein n=1 Tax=Hortaea werneckii TaxID=91943 RepID=A0A3M6ZIQ7_HORWE|nr:hypothetical protein KC324_g5388 [Hortaea werneckii]KAI7591785.1 hypothetical protein KC316_g2675 [Hortaea werneckii]RMX88187.1 hypothetical protein D0869_01802 [Hortaea werneckii]RMY15154.1 hypothetical protein D0868_01043 [Hortaea werneckii]